MMDGDRIEEILRPFLPFLSLFTQVFDSMPLLSLTLSLSLPSFFTLFQSILLYMKRIKSMIRNLFIASIPAFVGSA